MRHALLSLLVTLTAAAAAPPGGLVRGIYARPGAAVDNRLWSGYGQGYDLDPAERHGGQASLRASNAGADEARGGRQEVELNQPEPRPIVVSGWARLEGVPGGADYHCSVYVDAVLADGESWPMKIAAFDPTVQGWQYAEAVYTPPQPIQRIRAYVFLREKPGTAWFDDIAVQEVMDDAGTRSPNRLKDPGFEGETDGGTSPRDAFFEQLGALGCNAFHLYHWVPWERVMGDDPAAEPGPAPAIDPDDRMLDFVADAHRRGFRVWATVGLGLPRISDEASPWHPFWPCLDGRWGEGYRRAIAYTAQCGFDGIGMVPDEWTAETGRVAENYARSADAEVAAWYADLPPYCDDTTCRERFTQETGLAWPDIREPWSSADPVWAALTQFRYDATTAWIARNVAAAKAVAPDIVTDTMIGVHPVCLRDRLRTGAAWDALGAETGLDCLQTDPYIQLHNYRGDSTHWYPTETALHLTAANQRGWSGVTLETAALRDDQRAKQPVETYGAALSCFVHGARELFWWHWNHVTGAAGWVDGEAAARQVVASNEVLAALEPQLLSAAPSGEVLLVYSRASEDAWDRLEHAGALPPGEWTPKRGHYAHRNAMHWLLRRGVPFRMTFLDHPDPARLDEARVLIVPFPFALSEEQAALLRRQAEAGKTVILMSELSPYGADDQPLARPRLASLFGGDLPDPAAPGLRSARLGRGFAQFLGGDSAVGLLQPVEPVKDRQAIPPVPPLDAERGALLQRVLDEALGRPAALIVGDPEDDVEVVTARGDAGDLLLLTNWRFDRPARVTLRLPAGRGEGFAIARDGTVRPIAMEASGAAETVELPAQEARLLRWEAR